MSKKPVIASFWVGSELSWIEKLSLFSFVAHGYSVKLFTPEVFDCGIEDVEVINSKEIVQFDRKISKHAAPSFKADIFRLYLQKKTDFVWMDADMLSIKPVTPIDGYLIPGCDPGGQLNNAALRLPKDSEALQVLLEHIENPTLIPDWMDSRHKRLLKNTAVDDRLLEQGRMLRIVYGPRGLTYALEKTGEAKFAMPKEALAPIPWWLTDLFFSPKGGTELYFTEDTVAVHLFAAQLRKWHRNQPLRSGSFMGEYVRKIGFVGKRVV